MALQSLTPAHAAVELCGIVHKSIVQIRVNTANVDLIFFFFNQIQYVPYLVWFGFPQWLYFSSSGYAGQ